MTKVSENFKSCCKCARDGAGGALLSHAGCIVAPVVAGAFGGSISGAFMAAAMYVTSPLIAVAATYGLDRMRGQKSSVTKLASSAAIAVAIAVGINMAGGHSHHGGHEGHDHHGMTPDAKAPMVQVVPGGTIPPCGGTGGVCCGGQRLQPAQP
jgi:hypothetical protein